MKITKISKFERMLDCFTTYLRKGRGVQFIEWKDTPVTAHDIHIRIYMYVVQAHVCGTRVRVALSVCVQDMTRAHVKMKCQEKNATRHCTV